MDKRKGNNGIAGRNLAFDRADYGDQTHCES